MNLMRVLISIPVANAISCMLECECVAKPQFQIVVSLASKCDNNAVLVVIASPHPSIEVAQVRSRIPSGRSREEVREEDEEQAFLGGESSQLS